MTEKERYDLFLEIFGDGTLTIQEARARVYGNVVIDTTTEYGINRWFTEKGHFREKCAKFLALQGPYPAKRSSGHKGCTDIAGDFILPTTERLQDFIMPSNEWCYPALLAELEVLNHRKFWLEQAQKLVKHIKISDLVAQPLEQVDLLLLKKLVENISHNPKNTKSFAANLDNGLEIIQYLFNNLIVKTTYVENGEVDIEYVPSDEANLLASMPPTLKAHNLADPIEATPTKKQLARVKATSKQRYFINNKPIPSLLALDFYKTFKIFPKYSIVQSWLEESS